MLKHIDAGEKDTLSQLHSPVAFLPQEHLMPVEVGAADEPCVVKSMGMEDIVMS